MDIGNPERVIIVEPLEVPVEVPEPAELPPVPARTGDREAVRSARTRAGGSGRPQQSSSVSPGLR